MHIFRQGLLEGRSIALSGPVPGMVSGLLEELGASVQTLADPPSGADPLDDPASGAVPLDDPASGADPLDVLVVAEQDVGLADTWAAISAAATSNFIPQGAGRIVLISPRQDGSPTTAALENLARTLSVEWARHQITTSAVVPGPHTTDADLATIVAFLCSPAGAYFSGARFDMR